jgi:hypothetical protein
MPALKDKAITLLATSTALNTQTAAGAQTIFTTPLGKVTRIHTIVVRDPTASMVGATSLTFGTGWRNNGANDVSTMTTSGTDYMVLANTTKSTEIAAGTAFQMTPGTGTAGASTCIFDVFGYTT